MFNKFYSIFAGDIAIDLGTANTIIWVKGEGVQGGTCMKFPDTNFSFRFHIISHL